MKNVTWWKGMVVVLGLTLMASCGGGGGAAGGWNSGSENNPTFTSVDVAGNTVTTAAPNAPVIGKGSGLLQNGVYNVAMVDPNGAAVYSENLTLVSDGNGNLSDTVLAYLGSDTQSQAGAMVVSKSASGFEKVTVDYKAITPGQYTAYICKSTESTCDASTASATLTTTVDGTVPYVFSTDSTGTSGINSFENSVGDVYGNVANANPGSSITLRIVANSFQVFSEGDPLPAPPAGAVTPAPVCTVAADGTCGAPVLLWTDATATLEDQAALYDIVADVGGNGTWESATDFMDSPGYVPGFAIQNSSATPSSNVGAISIGGNDRIAQIAATREGSGYCSHRDLFQVNETDIGGYLNPAFQSLAPHVIAYKFIILHDDNLADGDDLIPIQNFGYDYTIDPLQWGCTNESCILLWPKGTQECGSYDVVLDVNQNLKYDSGIDFIDGYAGNPGFIISGCEGAPRVTINSITDGNGDTIEPGGTTSTSTSFFDITVELGTGSSISECKIAWIRTYSSSEAGIDITSPTDITTGGTTNTQPISLFNGTNIIRIFCLDNNGLLGAANTTIESTNAATENIHFQATLNWGGPIPDNDMDLHLIEPGGTMDSATDCYFANCKEDSGPYYTTTTGAFLNVDCISQCNGPENIWIPDTFGLVPGSYRVCVYPYSGDTASDLQVQLFDNGGNLIDTVGRASLTHSAGQTWLVGTFTCTAGTGGVCSWSKVDTLGTNCN